MEQNWITIRYLNVRTGEILCLMAKAGSNTDETEANFFEAIAWLADDYLTNYVPTLVEPRFV